MKYAYAIVLMITLFSCKNENFISYPKEAQQEKYPFTLSGKFTSIPNDTKISIKSLDLQEVLAEFEVKNNVPFSKQLFTKNNKGFVYMIVDYEFIPIYFKQNKEINVNIDVKNIYQTMSFSGDLAEENNLQNKLNTLCNTFNPYNKDYNNYTIFYNNASIVKQKQTDALNSSNLNDFFFEKVQKRAISTGFRSVQHLYFENKDYDSTYNELSKEEAKLFENTIKGIDLNSKLDFFNSKYVFIAIEELEQIKPIIQKKDENYYLKLLERANNKITNLKNKDIVLFQLVLEYVHNRKPLPTLNDEVIQAYFKSFTGHYYERRVEVITNNLIKEQEVSNNNIKVFKQNEAEISSLAPQFKNKTILYYFYSDYCGDCNSITANLYKPLQQKFQNKNIEYFNVFMGNRKKEIIWDEFTKRYKLKGTQAISSKENDNLIRSLNIQQLPHILILDKEDKSKVFNGNLNSQTITQIEEILNN